MNEPLALLPGVIWALDDLAYNQVRAWHENLDHRLKKVIQVASRDVEVRVMVQDYLNPTFDQVMVKAGLSLTPHVGGRRLALVLIAHSQNKEPFPGWELIEEEVEFICRESSHTEVHKIILAESNHLTNESLTKLAGGKFFPWYLAHTGFGGFPLAQKDFANLLARLLDALLLTEKEDNPAAPRVLESFYRPSRLCGQVRLVGFPRLDLEGLINSLSEILAKHVLRIALQKELRNALIRDFEMQFAGIINRFLRGLLPADKVVLFMVGREGLGSWRTGEILTAGGEILRKERDRLKRDACLPKSRHSQRPALVKRLLARAARVLGKPSAPLADSCGPGALNFDYVLKTMNRIIEMINALKDLDRKNASSSAALPGDFSEAWLNELDEILRRVLRSQWDQTDILGNLASSLKKTVMDNFQEIVLTWGLGEHEILKASGVLVREELWRFSARLRPDCHLQAENLVTSLGLSDALMSGGQSIPCARLRIWPGRPPLLLAASQPLALEHLNP